MLLGYDASMLGYDIIILLGYDNIMLLGYDIIRLCII